MIQVPADVLQAIERRAAADYVDRTSEFLRAALPRETSAYTNADLQSHIVMLCDKAARHNIKSELATTQYLMLALFFGSVFVESPEISLMLDDATLAPEQSLADLFEVMEASMNGDISLQ